MAIDKERKTFVWLKNVLLKINEETRHNETRESKLYSETKWQSCRRIKRSRKALLHWPQPVSYRFFADFWPFEF